MDLGNGGEAALADFQNALEIVEAKVTEITERPLEEVLNGCSRIEKARMRAILAYSLTALQICRSRIEGEGIANHPCMRCLDQLRSVFTRIDQCSGGKE
jgi:hypothetical protein